MRFENEMVLIWAVTIALCVTMTSAALFGWTLPVTTAAHPATLQFHPALFASPQR